MRNEIYTIKPTAAHRHEEVEDGPGENDDVINVHPTGHDSGGVSDTLEKRRYFKDTEAADGEHLTEGQLHEKHWYPSEKQREEVRD